MPGYDLWSNSDLSIDQIIQFRDLFMQLPHLSFLRSFEAAARHLSFTQAAEELNCTQAAVSHHIRALEDYVGRQLFTRNARSLTLTDTGEAYLPTIRHALQQIESATQLHFSQNNRHEVVISCPFSLAESWLVDVIGGFTKEHPDVDISVLGTIWNEVDLSESDILITIAHDDDVEDDLQPLWRDQLACVCAPDFLVQGDRLTKPVQIRDSKLVHVLGRTDYWEIFARKHGLEKAEVSRGFQANSSNLAIKMAQDGLGCVVISRSLVRDYLKRGDLIEPFRFHAENPWNYYARFNDKARSPSVRLFKSWLMAATAMNGK